ncbi:VirB6/TrbL-like conjugal transfer protein, CD1112 family, partial [Bacillus sp. SS-TM]
MLDDIIKGITNFFFDMLMGSTKSFLDMITELFQKSVDTVQTNVSETPTEFSQTIVDNLRIISDTAILPVAGLILTYVFCYELYQLVVEKTLLAFLKHLFEPYPRFFGTIQLSY